MLVLMSVLKTFLVAYIVLLAFMFDMRPTCYLPSSVLVLHVIVCNRKSQAVITKVFKLLRILN